MSQPLSNVSIVLRLIYSTCDVFNIYTNIALFLLRMNQDSTKRERERKERERTSLEVARVLRAIFYELVVFKPSFQMLF